MGVIRDTSVTHTYFLYVYTYVQENQRGQDTNSASNLEQDKPPLDFPYLIGREAVWDRYCFFL